MNNNPENVSPALRKELNEACNDLNHILGNEAAITPEQLIAHFAVPEKREQLSEPGLGADEILERMRQNEPATIPSARLVATGLTAFRKWALAGFSLVDASRREKRLAACKSCPSYANAPATALYKAISAGSICAVCGCSVDKKVRLSTENCPSPHPGNPLVSRWDEAL